MRHGESACLVAPLGLHDDGKWGKRLAMPLGWENVWPCQWAGEMSGHAAELGKRLAMPVGRGNVWPCRWAGETFGHSVGLGKHLAMPVGRG